ncbi:MAG: sugar phosphate isomerase/epimerase [Acidobacteriaceae bacterium]|nr:sugar phosphate isomerase/epimerase [Acidobacteriaceae bacterium]MBV9766316.1 sugar phosphate isomerase/epimerase [Acidobacteriaceae bacterium]
MSQSILTRRSVLATIPGGLCSLRVLSGQQYHIAGASFKLGVASYSFRKFSRSKAIGMTRQLGTPYLNVKDVHLSLNSTPEQIAAAKKEFDDAGIVLVGCGTVYFKEASDADIRPKFEYAKRAGFPLIVSMPNREVLPKLEKYVQEYDIKIAVHNHGPEDKNFPTPQSVLKVVKDMDPRCGLCIDIGHTARAGADVVESLAEAGPRLLDMHVKDLADPTAKESQVAVGEGKLPFPQIFLQLIQMKYSGSVNLEYEINEDDPLPGMQKSFSYMRGVLAGIEGAKYRR